MNARKKTIAVDIDDVLADGAQGFVNFSNKRWGTNLTIEDYNEHWGDMWQVDEAETIKRAQTIYHSNVVGKFRHAEAALPVLKRLKKDFKLVITTSRVRLVEKETLAWIDEHYKGIFDEIHLAGFFDGLPKDAHKQTKADLCKSIGADYLIDDHPKHCFAAAEAGIPSLLFGNYPWSRDLKKLPKNVVRVMSWGEIEKYFDDKARTV